MPVITLGTTNLENAGDNVYIIAEIGQNHQGSVDTAMRMIEQAKLAGCNCVKFQKSDLNAKFTQAALERAYSSEHSWGASYGEHKKYLEFNLPQYTELQAFCQALKIDFTASAMDELSLAQLDALNVPFIKIGSGDANNIPMLRKSAQLKRTLLISTGMQTMSSIDKIVEIMRAAGKDNFALMHCVSSYPTKPEDCCLQMIAILRQRFPDVVIGYSGHELGVEITKAAILLGARIIERHLTLNPTWRGSDHKCSLQPQEFHALTKYIADMKTKGLLNSALTVKHILQQFDDDAHAIHLALRPVYSKEILECELSCKQKLGKSIVAAHSLKSQQKLQSQDICIKVSEPNGIPAEDYELVLGSLLVTDLQADQPITAEQIIRLIK